jgi:hypothetical protein
MSHCTLVNETCPAAPGTVTLITNIFTVDGATTNWVHETLVPADSILTLPSLPVTDTLKVYKNGQVLVFEADYTRIDVEITLLVAPTDEDVYVVDYLAQPE